MQLSAVLNILFQKHNLILFFTNDLKRIFFSKNVQVTDLVSLILAGSLGLSAV